MDIQVSDIVPPGRLKPTRAWRRNGGNDYASRLPVLRASDTTV